MCVGAGDCGGRRERLQGFTSWRRDDYYPFRGKMAGTGGEWLPDGYLACPGDPFKSI